MVKHISRLKEIRLDAGLTMDQVLLMLFET